MNDPLQCFFASLPDRLRRRLSDRPLRGQLSGPIREWIRESLNGPIWGLRRHILDQLNEDWNDD